MAGLVDVRRRGARAFGLGGIGLAARPSWALPAGMKMKPLTPLADFSFDFPDLVLTRVD